MCCLVDPACTSSKKSLDTRRLELHAIAHKAAACKPECTPRHAMLSCRCARTSHQIRWAEVLPFIQLAHNTSFSATTVHDKPFFLMFAGVNFGCPSISWFPIDTVLGISRIGGGPDTAKLAETTLENLQLDFELARRNTGEWAEKQ